MNTNSNFDVPAQTGGQRLLSFLLKPRVKFLIGFLGWFILTLPVVEFPEFLVGAYARLNLVIATALVLFKRTRWAGVGVASAIAMNFIAATLLGTVLSPSYLAPVIHPEVIHNRWNFNFHHVSKDIDSELLSECVPNGGVLTQPASDAHQQGIGFVSMRGMDLVVYQMDGDGSHRERLDEYLGTKLLNPVWSPDGKKIAATSTMDGNFEIYVMNADGSDQKRLTENSDIDMSPSWSPDGEQIVFITDRDGNLEIYSMNWDGSNQTNLTRHPAQDSFPVWSPDGKQIAFESSRGNPEAEFPRNTGIYVMNIAGTQVAQVTGISAFGLRPTWSPNSRCILYQAGVSMSDWIMLQVIGRAEPVKLLHAGSLPRWSADGRWVVYTVVHGEWNQEIYTLDLITLQTFRLTNDSFNDTNPVWKP